MDFFTIGWIGEINLGLLAIIVLWRWIVFSMGSSSSQLTSFQRSKKHFFFSLLLLASVCDLPMYISFIVLQDYAIVTYSFHRLEAAAIFASYSLTISDWSLVLFEIREDSFVPFIIRKYALIFVNVVLFSISIVNFVYCFTVEDVPTYANTDIYRLSVFLQIIAPLVLTCIMLHAGIRLSWRIKGASGALDPSGKSANEQFQSAVQTINRIMVSIVLCILLQVVLQCLNFFLGYASKNKSFMPEMYYWVFNTWLPMWVLTLAQLYLQRPGANGDEVKSPITKSSTARGRGRKKHDDDVGGRHKYDKVNLSDEPLLEDDEMDIEERPTSPVTYDEESGMYSGGDDTVTMPEGRRKTATFATPQSLGRVKTARIPASNQTSETEAFVHSPFSRQNTNDSDNREDGGASSPDMLSVISNATSALPSEMSFRDIRDATSIFYSDYMLNNSGSHYLSHVSNVGQVGKFRDFG